MIIALTDVDDGHDGLALPDHPLCRAFIFFLFRTATSHALAGACSPEVDYGCFGRYCRLLLD